MKKMKLYYIFRPGIYPVSYLDPFTGKVEMFQSTQIEKREAELELLAEYGERYDCRKISTDDFYRLEQWAARKSPA